MYDKLSSKAVEFIDHEEILASIAWADENKGNRALIESLNMPVFLHQMPF